MSNEEKDVKEVEKNEEIVKEEKSDSSPEELGNFDDLFGSTDNKIPYSRFKEVNDEKKALKAELDKTKTSIKEQVEEALLKEQMKALVAPKDEWNLDSIDANAPVNTEVNSLKEELALLKGQLKIVSEFTENNALKQNLDNLRSSFPGMDEEHVLALKKMHPDANLEECAKYSHDKFNKHIKNLWNKTVEEKKAAQAQKSVIGAERIRNLKPEDKPKTLDEARAAFMKFTKD